MDDYKDKQVKELRHTEYREKRSEEKIERQRRRLAEDKTLGQFIERNKWNIFPGLVVAIIVILLIVLT